MNPESIAAPVAPQAGNARRRPFPVRTLLVALVLTCLVPGAIGVGVLIDRMYEAGQAEIERDTVRTARAMVQAVDGQLGKAKAVALSLATLNFAAVSDWATLHRRSGELLKIEGIGINVVVSDAGGQQLVNTLVPYGQPLPRHANAAQLKRVFETGESIVTDVFVGAATRQPRASIVVPVAVGGKVAYALGISIEPLRLQEILQQQNLPIGWKSSVFDSAGVIATRSSENEQFTGKPVNAAILRRLATESEAAFKGTTQEGVPALIAFSRSPLTHWGVAISIPLQALQSDLNKNLALLGFGGLVLFALSGGLALRLGAQVAASVDGLKASALAIEAGTAVELSESSFREAQEAGRAMAHSSRLLRRRALELAEQEKRHRWLVDGVSDYAIYMLDNQGLVTTWNQGAKRIKGYSADEVLGRHFSLFFIAEDVAAGKPMHELEVAEAEGRFETEDWRVHRNGTRFWASITLTPIHDDHDQLIGFAKITRDLTERRRREELLVRVVELAPCAMLMVDANGAVALVNAEAERMFGYTSQELLGQPVEILLPAPARAAHVGLRQAYQTAASQRVMGRGRDLYGLHRDGTSFPVEVGLSPIDWNGGLSTVAAVFDVSERRRQLLATERSLAEKETLLREVYHRVKNNLQVVQSLLTLQRHALPEGQTRTALDDTAERVRAMALVHEKLYQSGDLAAISLDAYTRDLVRQIAEAHGAARRGIVLHADIAPLETGLDNAVPFGLLLTELITNCLKHAFVAGRGGEIRVALTRLSGGDLLVVADDGVGFAPGFDAEAVIDSMGLQLATGLARQLGGDLMCRTDGGAIVSVQMKQL